MNADRESQELREPLAKTSLNVGFIASHNGTDMAAILAAVEAGELKRVSPRVVISNNSTAPALTMAHKYGLPTYHISARTHGSDESVDQAIRDTLVDNGVNLVMLSGYMKPIGPVTRREFSGRIINPHPADTNKYGGQHFYGDAVHRAVLQSDDEFTFPTLHLIREDDAGYDVGEVIAQIPVQIVRTGNMESDILALRAQVQEQEIALFQQVFRDILNGKLIL